MDLKSAKDTFERKLEGRMNQKDNITLNKNKDPDKDTNPPSAWNNGPPELPADYSDLEKYINNEKDKTYKRNKNILKQTREKKTQLLPYKSVIANAIVVEFQEHIPNQIELIQLLEDNFKESFCINFKPNKGTLEVGFKSENDRLDAEYQEIFFKGSKLRIQRLFHVNDIIKKIYATDVNNKPLIKDTENSIKSALEEFGEVKTVIIKTLMKKWQIPEAIIYMDIKDPNMPTSINVDGVIMNLNWNGGPEVCRFCKHQSHKIENCEILKKREAKRKVLANKINNEPYKNESINNSEESDSDDNQNATDKDKDSGPRRSNSNITKKRDFEEQPREVLVNKNQELIKVKNNNNNQETKINEVIMYIQPKYTNEKKKKFKEDYSAITSDNPEGNIEQFKTMYGYSNIQNNTDSLESLAAKAQNMTKSPEKNQHNYFIDSINTNINDQNTATNNKSPDGINNPGPDKNTLDCKVHE